MISLVNNIDTQNSKKANLESKKSNNGHSPSINVMAVIFMYLTKTSTILSDTAIIKAKQMRENSKNQIALNKQAAALSWTPVPKLNKKEKVIGHKWVFNIEGKKTTVYSKAAAYLLIATLTATAGVHFSVKEVPIKQTTIENQAAVSRAQTANEEVAAKRKVLNQKMQVLQQQASIHETEINTISDESAQVGKAGSLFQTEINDLTFKALMRPKP